MVSKRERKFAKHLDIDGSLSRLKFCNLHVEAMSGHHVVGAGGVRRPPGVGVHVGRGGQQAEQRPGQPRQRDRHHPRHQLTTHCCQHSLVAAGGVTEVT